MRADSRQNAVNRRASASPAKLSDGSLRGADIGEEIELFARVPCVAREYGGRPQPDVVLQPGAGVVEQFVEDMAQREHGRTRVDAPAGHFDFPHLAAGRRARSITTTRTPRAARSMAAASPAMPAPMTATVFALRPTRSPSSVAWPSVYQA